MAKLESNNVTIIGNDKVGVITIGQNGKIPTFMKTEYLEELRDLINDYLEMRHKNML